MTTISECAGPATCARRQRRLPAWRHRAERFRTVPGRQARWPDLNSIHERSYQYAPVDLEAGKLYPIRLDFTNIVNDADIRLVWSRPRRRSLARRLSPRRGRPMPWCWCWGFRRGWKARR